jgi:hypothetical protein
VRVEEGDLQAMTAVAGDCLYGDEKGALSIGQRRFTQERLGR